MTLSNEERARQKRDLLLLFAQQVGDGYCIGQLRGPKTEDFAAFDTTTWAALTQQGALAAKHAIGRAQYTLTPFGWRIALQLAGQLELPEVRARAAALVQALKAAGKGRASHIGTLVDERTLSATTDLPAGWIYNALSSDLLNEIFPNQDMSVTE
jgi:hypothetical protein